MCIFPLTSTIHITCRGYTTLHISPVCPQARCFVNGKTYQDGESVLVPGPGENGDIYDDARCDTGTCASGTFKCAVNYYCDVKRRRKSCEEYQFFPDECCPKCGE